MQNGQPSTGQDRVVVAQHADADDADAAAADDDDDEPVIEATISIKRQSCLKTYSLEPGRVDDERRVMMVDERASHEVSDARDCR
jgi:hypothetical protein